VVLLTKVTEPSERESYAVEDIEDIEHGCSRTHTAGADHSQLHLRQGVALTNFSRHLATSHAQLAVEALKDAYHFDFFRESSDYEDLG
jgi:hypothetical protein